MAYGLKYTTYKQHPNGDRITLKIYQNGWTGSSYSIGAVTAFALQVQGDQSSVTSPIVKTSVNITLKDFFDKGTTQADGTTCVLNGEKWGQWEEFYTNDPVKYRVDVEYSGGLTRSSVVWSGFLTPDSWGEDMVYGGDINLTARDMLGYLDEQEFDLTGRITVQTLIDTAITRSKAAMAVTFHTTECLYNSNGSSILAATIGASTYAGDTWYSALEKCLESLGLVLRYNGNGGWFVTSLRYLAGHTIETHVPTFISRSGYRTLDPAIKLIEEVFNPKVEALPIDSPAFADYSYGSGTISQLYDAPTPATYTYPRYFLAATHSKFSGNIALPYASDGSTDPDDYNLYFPCNVSTFSSVGSMAFSDTTLKAPFSLSFSNPLGEGIMKLAGSGTSWTLTRLYSPGWKVTSVRYKLTCKVSGTTYYWAGSENGWRTTDTELTTPLDETVTVDTIVGGTDFSVVIVSLVATTDTMATGLGAALFAPLNISLTAVDNNDLAGEYKTTTIYNEDNHTEITRQPSIGAATSELVSLPMACNLLGYGNNIATDAWKFSGDSTTFPLAVMIHAQLLVYNGSQNGNSIFTGNFLDSTRPVSIPGSKYTYYLRSCILVSGSYDFLTGYVGSATLREVLAWGDVWTTFDPEYEVKTSKTEGGTSSAGGGSSSGGGSGSGTKVAWGTEDDDSIELNVAGTTKTLATEGHINDTSNPHNTTLQQVAGTTVYNQIIDLLSLFEKDTTSVSGTTLIKAKYALYSDQEITAGGVGSGGGGGGGLASVYFNGTRADDGTQAKFGIKVNGSWATVAEDSTYGKYVNIVTSGGSVTSIATGTGLTGGPITSTGTIAIASDYLTKIDNGQTAYDDLTTVSTALQSLQAQVDAVASRNNYDELTASVLSTDVLAAQTGYVGTLNIGTSELTASKVSGYDTHVATTGDATIHHTHSNKALLDTYTQTEANLADAVSKKHSHANKTSVLDKLQWDEDNNAIYFGSSSDKINFYVFGEITAGGSGSGGGGTGSAIWGAITGTLSNQADLQTALNAKQATISDLATIRSNAANGNTAYGWGNHANAGYLTAHQSVVLASGTNNGTLKITVGGVSTDNVAVTGLAALAYKASLEASDIPSLAASKITSGTFADARIASASSWNAAYTHSQTADGSNPHATTFANIASKPTTINGFGITDAYTITEIDNKTITVAGTALKFGDSISADTIVGAATSSATFAGNSATATKLKTARNIWGQSFNGTAAISGDMTGVGKITFTSAGTGEVGLEVVEVNGTRMLHTSLPFYSDEEITAGGVGSGGSGSGGSLYALSDVKPSTTTTTKVARYNDVTDDAELGDLLMYDGNSHWWALAKGTNGKILKMVSGIPTWSDETLGTVTSIKVGTTEYTPASGVVSLPAYPTTLPASDVYSWAKASTKPSYTLDEVTDGASRKWADKQDVIPANTYAPYSHTHTIADVTGLQSALDAKATTTALTTHTGDTTVHITAAERTAWNAKQAALTAGTNITISGTTISATDTTYSAGTGLSLTGTQFSIHSTYLGYITNGQAAYDAQTTVSLALQSLQSQIDAVASRSQFDEVIASSLYADNLSAANALITAITGNLTGNVTGNVTGNLTGNATTASYLVSTSHSAGSSVNPVYFTGGRPSPCSYSFGNASGNAALNNGTLNTDLNADMLDGKHAYELFTALSSSSSNNISLTIGGTTRSYAQIYATYDASAENIATCFGTVSTALQSLQAQVDAIGSRSQFDEVAASTLYADNLSASRAQVASLTAKDGISVTAGGVTVTAGGLTVSAGGASIGGTLYASGAASLGSTLTVAGNVSTTGNISTTGNLLCSSTSQTIGTSAAPWGEIHGNKWYPNANDTTNYIEYTGGGFLIHGNVSATGEVTAGA